MYSHLLRYISENIRTQRFLVFQNLLRNQQLSYDRLEELQWKKFKVILNHAYYHLRFYNKKFKDARIHPSDIQKKCDLSKIPITTKSELRTHFPVIFKEQKIRKYRYEHTSGSTGEPFTVYYDDAITLYLWAISERMNRMANFYLGDKAILFERSWPWFRDPTHRRNVNPLIGHTWDFILRRKRLNLLETTFDGNLKRIQKFQPDVIRGQTSYMRELAFSLEQGSIHPKSIITMAEVLLPEIKNRLKNVFNTNVFDQYGTTELGMVAGECSAEMGYHINSDTVLLEIVDETTESLGPGESGRILGTNLFNYVMPFIRFDTQDIGIMSDELCSCGRNFPLLAKIEGKQRDSILTPAGHRIFPNTISIIFTRIIRKYGRIQQFQVIQKSIDSLLLKIVRDSNVSDDMMNKTLTQIPIEFKKAIPGLELTVEEVSSIGTLAEKHRFILSEIHS